jgi:His/Glu/Gln/Arg/opine family amino acid ABC transporter permease subunit
MHLDFERIWPSLPYILEGIPITLAYTSVSLFFGFVMGAFLALFKVGDIKPLNWFAAIYTSVFRGTPLILQLSLIYFATPQLVGYDISAWQAGILTFSMNSAAYISEIIRAGIQAVDKGQMEAALSLGLPYPTIMKDIILPQAIRNILPSLVNESIDLLKESALISVIGGADILRRATVVANEKYIYFEPLIVAGLLYYVMVMILAMGAKLLERKLRLQ